MTPLAIIRERRGSLSALARHLGITPAAICHWKQVPAKQALKVAEFTGIPVHELRPDVFGPASPSPEMLTDTKHESASDTPNEVAA